LPTCQPANLPSGKTGSDWAAMADQSIAYWRDGAWTDIPQKKAWLAHAVDTDALLIQDDTTWSHAASRGALGLGPATEHDVGACGETLPLLSIANDNSAQ
jgi:hypothetical protein